MNAPDAVVHIGMQQSGATMLQRALSRLRPQLRAHGVAYVGHTRLGELDHVSGWECRPGADRAQAEAFERELSAAVEDERRNAAEARGDGAGVTLLSSDHLVGGRNIGPDDAEVFRPHAFTAIAQAIRALGAERVRLVLYTHRQDRLMEYCYLREIQKGRHHSFRTQFPYRFTPALDYVDLVERLRALPQVAEVRVRPYELVHAGPVAFVDDFLDAVGLQGALRLDAVGTGLAPHHVYSRRGLKVALAMNPHLETDAERRLVRGFLLENFAAPDERSSRFLPKAVRQQILEVYREPNRRLFRRYLPDLPEDGYASNEATPSLGMTLTPVPAPVSGRDPTNGSGTRGGAREAARTAIGRVTTRDPLLYRLRVRYLARRCDAFLVSFPKCGRTWLRVMLGHALAEHADLAVRNPLRFTTADVDHPEVPCIIATHDDSPQMKPAARVLRDKRAYRNAKVVWLVRDPRDVVVSLYFHVTHRRGQHYEGDLADFVREPTGSLASLLAFYDAWTAHRAAGGNVLVVRYEDMHADPAHELRRVLAYLGADAVSDAVVSRAVAAASFDRLQQEERTGTARTRALRTDAAEDPESYKVRRGVVGGYRDYLDTADVRYLAAAIAGSPGARDLGYADDGLDERSDERMGEE